MSKKLYWAIDINNPASWEEVEEDEVLDINTILKKIDRLQELAWKEKVHNDDVIDIELKHQDYIKGLYNGLEIATAIFEDREPNLK